MFNSPTAHLVLGFIFSAIGIVLALAAEISADMQTQQNHHSPIRRGLLTRTRVMFALGMLLLIAGVILLLTSFVPVLGIILELALSS